MDNTSPPNNILQTESINIIRQLRPSVTPESIINLMLNRYSFTTSSRNDAVVGVATYYNTASLIRGAYIYLADLVVDENHRGHKVGTEMMTTILNANTTCELDSGLEKANAHRFYQNLGFVHRGYAVRSEINANMPLIDNIPKQPTIHIANFADLINQSEDTKQRIQKFIDDHLSENIPHQFNLNLFMQKNPNHRLLLLEGEQRSIEGILVYELQARLSVNGNCYHVTDLIVKSGASAIETEEKLMLSLLQLAASTYQHKHLPFIKSVIFEMTEEQIMSHHLFIPNKANSKDDCEPLNFHSTLDTSLFFSVTAKHFIHMDSSSFINKMRPRSQPSS